MVRRLTRILGWGLFGLVFVGLWLTVLAAVRAGQPFYGVNYKHLPLGTYSTLAALTVVTIIFSITGGRALFRAIKHRRKRL